MRLVVIPAVLMASLVVSGVLLGCSGSGTGIGPVSQMVVSPPTLSLNIGEVSQVTGTPEDARGNAVYSATVTYAVTPVGGAVDVSTGGLVCAGKWDSDTNPVNCTPGSPGAATITATTTVSGQNFSATVPVTVHEHVDQVTLQPVPNPAPTCVSQGAAAPANTLQYQAKAYTKCTTSNTGLCEITQDFGAPTWTTDQPTVAELNLTTQPANQSDSEETVTAGNPGVAHIFATVSGVTSLPVPFSSCAAASISTHVSGSSSTSFTLSGPSTQQLQADVTDSQGVPFTSITVSWNSSQPHVATAGAGGVVSAVSPGTSGISSACTPPACNVGLNPVYGNLVTATVSGTSLQSVYVTTTAPPASGSNNSLIPIVNNVAGTAIALPTGATINSMVFNPLGTTAYLGSDQGLIVLAAVTNTVVPPVTTVTGKVLAISPDGNHVIVSDAGNPTPGSRVVYVYNTANSTLDATLNISNATAAEFSPDGYKAFIVGGNTLYVWGLKVALQTVLLGGTGNNVSVLPSGHVALAAVQGAGDEVVAVCNNQTLSTISAASPAFVRAIPNADGGVDVTTSGVDQFDVTVSGGCPPNYTNSAPSPYTFSGVASFTPFQLLMTPDSSRAIVISDHGVLVYHVGATATAGSTSVVPLSGSATPTTGGVSLDSTTTYVGGSDGNVHVIDLTANSGAGGEKQAISVSVKPDLVAIRPQ
jgi:hypothetical protein